jgi:hypothetical protein
MDGRYRWHLARGRDGIIGKAGRQELTGGVVDYLFVEGRPDTLGDRAVNLAVDDHRIDHVAAILGDNIAVEVHFVGLRINLQRHEAELKRHQLRSSHRGRQLLFDHRLSVAPLAQ